MYSVRKILVFLLNNTGERHAVSLAVEPQTAWLQPQNLPACWERYCYYARDKCQREGDFDSGTVKAVLLPNLFTLPRKPSPRLHWNRTSFCFLDYIPFWIISGFLFHWIQILHKFNHVKVVKRVPPFHRGSHSLSVRLQTQKCTLSVHMCKSELTF